MLYRHVQSLFLSSEYTAGRVRGPNLRVRPLDTDAPDHLLRFVFWGIVQSRPITPVRTVAPPATPAGGTQAVVVSTPSSPKMLIEMSADGEGWVVQSTLEARDRPYLVTVAHMLQHIRVRLDGGTEEARGYALVMANAPFALDGQSTIVGPGATRPGGRP
jgi:hypothetical protein